MSEFKISGNKPKPENESTPVVKEEEASTGRSDQPELEIKDPKPVAVPTHLKRLDPEVVKAVQRERDQGLDAGKAWELIQSKQFSRGKNEKKPEPQSKAPNTHGEAIQKLQEALRAERDFVEEVGDRCESFPTELTKRVKELLRSLQKAYSAPEFYKLCIGTSIPDPRRPGHTIEVPGLNIARVQLIEIYEKCAEHPARLSNYENQIASILDSYKLSLEILEKFAD